MKSRGMTSDEVQAIWDVAGYRCERCWVVDRVAVRDGLEIHHRLPRSRARNLHDRWNGCLLCNRCHRHAHATSVWPWSVPGYTLRGLYVGPDPAYAAVYSGAPVPTFDDLQGMGPGVTSGECQWVLDRARSAIALGWVA